MKKAITFEISQDPNSSTAKEVKNIEIMNSTKQINYYERLYGEYTTQSYFVITKISNEPFTAMRILTPGARLTRSLADALRPPFSISLNQLLNQSDIDINSILDIATISVLPKFRELDLSILNLLAAVSIAKLLKSDHMISIIDFQFYSSLKQKDIRLKKITPATTSQEPNENNKLLVYQKVDQIESDVLNWLKQSEYNQAKISINSEINKLNNMQIYN